MKVQQAILPFLILAALAAGPAAAEATAPAGAAAAIEKLLAAPPRQLSQLEAIAGDLHRDRAKWEEAVGPLEREKPAPYLSRARVALDIDVFHFDPRQIEDPPLGDWRLDFNSGRDAARKRLEAAGAPQELSNEGNKVWRFGDYYFQEGPAPQAFTLSWYQREPLFAVPERGPEETAALAEKLAAVAAAQFARAAVEKHFGSLQPQKGSEAEQILGKTFTLEYSPAGAEYPKQFRFSLKRELPAEPLAAKLGLRRPVVLSPDGHMQARNLGELLEYEELRRDVEAESKAAEAPATNAVPRTYRVAIAISREGLQDYPGFQNRLWSIAGAGVRALQANLAPEPGARPLVYPRENLPAATAPDDHRIVFVCEHGSAKSVIAAAHFNALAQQRGLPWRAVARGTVPDAEMAPAALKGMQGDGLPDPQGKPVLLNQADLDSAREVVLFAVDLPADLQPRSSAATWQVPPVSVDYAAARSAIVAKIEQLLTELGQE